MLLIEQQQIVKKIAANKAGPLWVLSGDDLPAKQEFLKKTIELTLDNKSMLAHGTHPDLLEFNKLTIDNVRDIIEFTHTVAQIAHYKIIVIKVEANLQLNAANALLKTLEEPQVPVLFFIVVNNKYKLIETILSRAHVLEFKQDIWPTQAVGLILQSLVDLWAKGDTNFLDVADNWWVNFKDDSINYLWWALNKIITYKYTQDAGLSGLSDYAQILKKLDENSSLTKLWAMFSKVQIATKQLQQGFKPNIQLILEDLLLTGATDEH